MSNHNRPWWEEPDGAAGEAVIASFKALSEEQSARRKREADFLRMYSNRMFQGLSGSDWSTYDPRAGMRMNVIKPVVNTVVAQIATNKVRPMFLTRKGSRKERKQGEALGRFCVGLRHKLRQHQRGLEVFRDSAIFGDGMQKILRSPDGTEVETYRVLPDDVVVDEVEARDGEPRTMYHYRAVDPYVLIAMYGKKHKFEVEGASPIRDALNPSLTQGVGVVEAWRLPDGPGKHGRRVICIEGLTLVDEDFDEMQFPIAKHSWDSAVIGWRGIGLVEEIASVQMQINIWLNKVEEIMNLNSAQIWIEKGSEIAISSLNNRNMVAREYRGKPPMLLSGNAVPQEFLIQGREYWNKAFEIAGVTAIAATGQKPEGLDSGKAIRAYRDITSRRFLHTQQRWESFNVEEIDSRFVDCARQITEEQGRYRVLTSSRSVADEIDFASISLDRDSYLMQVWPVSLLPDEPSGQMQTLKEFGDISPQIRDQLISTLQYPDLDGAVSSAMAPQKYIELVIDRALDEGKGTYPDAFVDPSKAIPMVSYAILEAQEEGVDDSKVDLLRGFLTDLEALHRPPEPPAPMPIEPSGLPPGPMQPPAPPMPGEPVPPLPPGVIPPGGKV